MPVFFLRSAIALKSDRSKIDRLEGFHPEMIMKTATDNDQLVMFWFIYLPCDRVEQVGSVAERSKALV